MNNSEFEELMHFVYATRKYCESCAKFKRIDDEAKSRAQQINTQIEAEYERAKGLFLAKDIDEKIQEHELKFIKNEIETLCAELVSLHEPNKLLKFIGKLTRKI